MYVNASGATPAKVSSLRGFTLIETMVVVALVAILASLAAPSFQETVQRYRVDSARDALATSIQVARIEAIRNGRQVNIVRQACALNNWGCGWVIYVDLNANNLQDANEPTLRQIDALENMSIIKGDPADRLSISRFGQSVGIANTTFDIGPTGKESTSCKSLVLNVALRQRTESGTESCPA